MATFTAPSEGGSLSERIAMINAKRGAKKPSELATPVVQEQGTDAQAEAPKDSLNRVPVNAKIDIVDTLDVKNEEPGNKVDVVTAIAELAKLMDTEIKEIKKINKHLNSIVKTLNNQSK